KDPRSYSVPSFIANGQALVIDVRNPITHYDGPWTTKHYANEDGAKVRNWGAYVYDQISLNEHWEIAAGLRYDKFKVRWYDEDGSRLPAEQSDGVWSGRLGV